MEFSIILPTYNRGFVIHRPIESALRLKNPNWELVIFDDGSTDDTAGRVARYRDARIRYLRNEENNGVNYARNRAIEAARGDWVTFLDSDDEMLPEALDAARAKRALHPGFDLLGFSTRDERGRSTCFLARDGLAAAPRDFLDDRMLRGDFLFFARRAIFDRHKFVDGLPGLDGLTWYLIAKDHPAIFFKEPLIVYWQDTVSIKRNDGRLAPESLDRQIAAHETKLSLAGADLASGNRKALARLHSALAGCYFRKREKAKGLRSNVRALRWNPLDRRAWKNFLFVLLPFLKNRR